MREVVPTMGRVLVRLDRRTKETEGGLYLPDVATRQPWMGTVEAVGPGAFYKAKKAQHKRKPPAVKVGDRICVGPYNGENVTHWIGADDGHERWIVDTEDTTGRGLPDVYGVEDE